MAIIKCEKGHFYDTNKYTKCPFCCKGEFNDPEDKTVHLVTSEEGNPIQKVQLTSRRDAVDEERTVGFFSPQKGNDYVVGWLVCTEGKDKGRDFRLHHGFNRIGRDYGNDVVLAGDQTIARTSHCSIAYEDKSNQFFLIPEHGNATYFRDGFLDEPVLLKSHDVFEIGESKMEFIAFCEGGKKWKK